MFDEEIMDGKKSIKVVDDIAKLAAQCLKLEDKLHPEMVEVADRLRKCRKDVQLCRKGAMVEASVGACNQGTGSKNSSNNATDTSTSGTKTSGSLSSVPCTRAETNILESSNVRKFTFSELKSSTRNFRPDFVLGEGGFGCVYKGWMDEHTLAPVKPGAGMVVVVKKLNLNGFQGPREWLAEVYYLGHLSHPNLVKLIGYCLEDERRFLVYEYIPRGSLEHHLFRRGSQFQPLSWNLRMKVALEAARVLAFLHSDQANVIKHGFKTSDILLDSEYNVKLSDFGLAKHGPSGDDGYICTMLMDTYEYTAPEYVATGHLTLKSDVYSYGVLLDLLSGQRVLDKNRPPGQQDLVEWARPYITNKRRVIRVLDSRLSSQYSLPVAQKIAALALQCLSMDARCRPGMDQVVTVLEGIQEEEAKGAP